MNNNDDLETTMNAIFSDTDDTEREPEVVEVINDDYTGYDTTTANKNNGDNINVTPMEEEDNITVSKESQLVPKLLLLNVFEEGRKKMVDLNIPKMRKRKKDRLKRAAVFFLDIHDIITNSDTSIDVKLDSITNAVLFNPWYCCSYRSAMK